MMPVIYIEELRISAPDTLVYDTIVNFSGYKHWNPWILDAKGKSDNGESCIVTMNVGKKAFLFKHKIVAAIKPSAFHWCDTGWFTFFAYGERKRTITALSDDVCYYRCELTITGFFSPIASLLFGRLLKKGMASEAYALKRYAENEYHEILYR